MSIHVGTEAARGAKKLVLTFATKVEIGRIEAVVRTPWSERDAAIAAYSVALLREVSSGPRGPDYDGDFCRKRPSSKDAFRDMTKHRSRPLEDGLQTVVRSSTGVTCVVGEPCDSFFALLPWPGFWKK